MSDINNNLYEQAKALYRSLFIDYDSCDKSKYYTSELGQIPIGWEVKELRSVTQNIRTKVKDGSYKVLSALNTGILQPSEEYFTKQVYSKDISNYIVVSEHDFAYNPARINIGSIGINNLGYTGCVSPVYVVVRAEKGYHNFLDFFIKSPRFTNEVKSRASGSVRQSLNYDDFGLIKVIYPPKHIVESFNHQYNDILSLINHFKNETKILTGLRDSLLPKLISGEIDVTDFDI